MVLYHKYACENLCESVKTGPSRNLRDAFFCFLRCNVWRDKNLCGTNLCNQRFTHIIRINKTRTEKCRFMACRHPMLLCATIVLNTLKLPIFMWTQTLFLNFNCAPLSIHIYMYRHVNQSRYSIYYIMHSP